VSTQALDLVLGTCLVPLAIVGYLLFTERVISRLPGPRSSYIRPWLWFAPALVLICGILAYPLGKTVYLSLMGPDSTTYQGLENYQAIVTDEGLVTVLKVNLLWIVLFPLFAVLLGLLTATVLDRVPYERIAKAIITVPTAISFVAGSVVWRLMYTYNPPGTPQIGGLNAFLDATVPGFTPKAWLIDPRYNNYALIVVGIWMGTGLATLILSAAIKGIPKELLEAARIDGAGEWSVFRRVMLPQLVPALAVVTTISIIAAIKVFDIVYVMTGGNYGTDVIATRMYSEQFSYQNTGLASAIAIVLLLAVSPVLVANWRVARREASG
jgi:alpha-glucoside transport system permease protein